MWLWFNHLWRIKQLSVTHSRGGRVRGHAGRRKTEEEDAGKTDRSQVGWMASQWKGEMDQVWTGSPPLPHPDIQQMLAETLWAAMVKKKKKNMSADWTPYSPTWALSIAWKCDRHVRTYVESCPCSGAELTKSRKEEETRWVGDEVESEGRQQRKKGNCRKILIAFHSPEIVSAGRVCAGMLQEKVQQSKLFKAKKLQKKVTHQQIAV